MKTTQYLLTIVLLATIISCKNEKTHNHDLEVKQVEHNHEAVTKKLDVNVDNEIDPICGMNTNEFLTDTVQYQGKVYGFCGPSCKDEFKKNPSNFTNQ